MKSSETNPIQKPSVNQSCDCVPCDRSQAGIRMRSAMLSQRYRLQFLPGRAVCGWHTRRADNGAALASGFRQWEQSFSPLGGLVSEDHLAAQQTADGRQGRAGRGECERWILNALNGSWEFARLISHDYVALPR